MKRVLAVLTAAVVFSAAGVLIAEDGAQDNTAESIRLKFEESFYANWFKRADANQDGFVTPDEAKAAGLKWECFASSKRWQNADADGDGKLSLEEAMAEKRFEFDLIRRHLSEWRERIRNRLATPGVDFREREQLGRILSGIANGSLTMEEAQDLLAGERRIREMEAAAKADGVVTLAEREELHKVLNEMCVKIHQEKNDAEKRPPGPRPPVKPVKPVRPDKPVRPERPPLPKQ